MIASSKIGTLRAFCKAWDAISRDRETFTRWMADHVMATLDHAAFLRSIEGG
jgi:hypothetical protein